MRKIQIISFAVDAMGLKSKKAVMLSRIKINEES